MLVIRIFFKFMFEFMLAHAGNMCIHFPKNY